MSEAREAAIAAGLLQQGESLQPGDTIILKNTLQPSGSDVLWPRTLVFVVMPHRWQGSPMDAGKRLRSGLQTAFRVLARGPADAPAPLHSVELKATLNDGKTEVRAGYVIRRQKDPASEVKLKEDWVRLMGEQEWQTRLLSADWDVVSRILTQQDAEVGPFEWVALPNLAGGIFGYLPKHCTKVLCQEAFEALLQLEASSPPSSGYTLRRISFVESDRETAEGLVEALHQVARRWLPEMRQTSAPEWWTRKTRRLLVLPDSGNFFQRRMRVKFKKFHGLDRRARRTYLCVIKPLFWRAARVHQPPPLQVYERSREESHTESSIPVPGNPTVVPQEDQSPARPYFYRGVTHWLFPVRRSGFHGLKRDQSGKWVGANLRNNFAEQTSQRL